MSHNEVIKFINRLSRYGLSDESCSFILNETEPEMREVYGENYNWVMLLISSILKNENHDEVLLNQDLFPDVKTFIAVVRKIMLSLDIKIS